jgi:exopolysaccharide biosynthesis polyprenyl glycosylphosphotransferase
MLRAKEENFKHLFSVIDLLISLSSFLLSYYWMTGQSLFEAVHDYLALFLFQVPVWFLLARLFNIHQIQFNRSSAELLVEYMKAGVIAVSAMIYALYLFGLNDIRQDVFILFIGLNFTLLYTFKIITNKLFSRLGSRASENRNLVVIADEKSCNVIDTILNTPGTGFVIKAILSDSPVIHEKYGLTIPVISEHSDIRTYLIDHPIHELHYCKDNFVMEELRNLVYACQEVGVTFRMKSILFNHFSTSSTIKYLADIPFITISNLPDNYLHLRIKRLMDLFISFFALVLSFPFMLVIALLIKLTSKGPVFYCQERSGLRGRKFKLYKFRTMVINSDELRKGLEELNEMDGPVFKIKNDPRITRIGLFLRKTSIDEFPQFLNVVRGEMSVVGPRPPIPAEVKKYEDWQLRRISIKPGITCIWQVSGRNNTTFDDWMRQDLEYIDNWSLQLDLVICLKTIKTILSMNGR